MTDEERLDTYMLKEIDLIQEIIKRRASNSFLLKGWTITLVVATLLLKGSVNQVLLAFIPIFVFWYLDAYFLWQERMYRKLYNWVVENRPKTDEHLFDLNAYRFEKDVQSKPRIMFSTTLGSFYGSILALAVVYIIILLNAGS